MTACCDRMRQLPGGPMCPRHGRQTRPERRPRRPSDRPHWSSVNRFHDGRTASEAVDDMLAGLIRALETLAAFKRNVPLADTIKTTEVGGK